MDKNINKNKIQNFGYFSLIKTKKSGHLNYAQFELNELTPGQGITIGNLIRRVLLGELEGMAISAIRIGGKSKHPFSSIEGIREDTLEILLNLKGIVIKSTKTGDSYGRLRVQGPSVVTANLIELPDEIEIVNPNHYIATVTTSITFEIEFQFRYGVGYKLASGEKQNVEIKEVESDILPQDYIDVDCIYTPIRKVNFEIENVYNEDNSLSERLVLEICTDGSIEPIHALKKSCEIIRDVFNSLIKIKENINSNELFGSTLDIESRKSPTSIIKILSDKEAFIKSKKQKTLVEQYRNIPIEELDLSVRPYNCLKKENINTVGELLRYKKTQLQKIRNFGRKSGDEVSFKLKEKFNIKLKEDKDP